MKLSKRIVSLLLAICMLFSVIRTVFPVYAAADSADPEEEIIIITTPSENEDPSDEEERPAASEDPAASEIPGEEEIPSESEDPLATEDQGEEDIPSENEDPAANEDPVGEENPVESEDPAAVENDGEEENPGESEDPAETEEQIGRENPAESDEPVAPDGPGEEEPPAESEDPAASEDPGKEELPLPEGSDVIQENYSAGIPFHKLTEDRAENLAIVAESQIGMCAQSEDSIMDADGTVRLYSRYGAWYGDAYMRWNSVFALYCLHYAGFAVGSLAFDADCGRWLNTLRENGLTSDPKTGIPQKGSIVFTIDENGTVRVGVFTELCGEDDPVIVLAEGDCGGRVSRKQYPLYNDSVLCYVQLATPFGESPSDAEEPAEAQEPGETEDPNEAEEPGMSDDPTEAQEPGEDEDPTGEEDPAADDPTEDVPFGIPYEQLTGNTSSDLLIIAQSQLGYTESTEDAVEDQNGALHGYTRYGAWHGDAYAPWNSLFTLFCLHFAGISVDSLDFDADCGQWLNALREQGIVFHPDVAQVEKEPADAPADPEPEEVPTEEPTDEPVTPEQEEEPTEGTKGPQTGEEPAAGPKANQPQKGCLMFTIDEQGNVRVGILCDVFIKESDTVFELIEGDVDGSVARRQYRLGGKEELSCVSLESLTADRQNPASFSSTLADVIAALPLDALTGDWVKDLLLIANSQLGYTESETDSITDKTGREKGYTCYGEFFGHPYGDWCAMFIGFCLHFANVPASRFPRASGVIRWMEELKRKQLYREADNYLPSVGDIVFFSASENQAGHVGIVTSVILEEETKVAIHSEADGLGDTQPADSSLPAESISSELQDQPEAAPAQTEEASESKEPAEAEAHVDTAEFIESEEPDAPEKKPVFILSVLQGNTDNRVCIKTCELTDPSIMGYGLFSVAQSIPAATATVYTDESKAESAEGTGIRIEFFGDLPEGTYGEAYPSFLKADACEHLFSAWEIALFDADGNPMQPENGSVTVKITTPEAADALASYEELGIYHLHNGTVHVLDRAPVVTETYYSFETDAFSVFALGTVPYSGDYIHIDNFEQLQMIGSRAVVTDTDTTKGQLGKGAPVLGGSGEPLTYSLDAHYYLDHDIRFPDGKIWTLPDGFTGNFGGPIEADETRLYEQNSDTLYLQNQYQLAVLSADDREDSPVMTGDALVRSFGLGQFIFPDEESGAFLTYGEKHHYVLSSAFYVNRYDRPLSVKKALLRGAPNNADLIDGRDYFGQVTVDIDGTTYILIGDRQQLDAINNSSDSFLARTLVYGPVFEVYQRRRVIGNWDASNITEERVTVIYPGDADLVANVYDGQTVRDFSQNVMYSGNNGILSTDTYHSLTAILDFTGYDRTFYCTVDPATGTWSIDQRSNPTLTYEKDGNYIVFRDIDMTVGALNGTDWRPMMFTGTMYGVKAENRTDVSALWNAAKTEMNLNTSRKPVISNVTVIPVTHPSAGKERLDVDEQEGVGFFGTIESRYSYASASEIPTVVKNIKLLNGTVTNPAESSNVDVTIISGLVTTVAAVLGVVLDTLLSTLTSLTGDSNYDLTAMLTSLLNARRKDPTLLATGSFAGRIIGDATVSDCVVEHFTVTTVATSFENDSSTLFDGNYQIVGKGGFVGYVEGKTEYNEATYRLIESLTGLLSGLLNVIPYLGLGDLVTLLLENVLPLSLLAPVGYMSPKISDCVADDCTLSTEDAKYGVGGFAGSMAGTVIERSVVRNSTMTVNADHFGGGFVGVERDAAIRATLSDLNISIISALHPQSELIECAIENCEMTVTGGTYLGGFAGVQANSYAFDCIVDEHTDMTVAGTGDYVGGFTGKAQLGTLFTMGDFLPANASLLGTVSTLLSNLLSSNNDTSLLDLGGISPSAIMGCQMLGPLRVTSYGNFVGGIVGRGDGVYITDSSSDNMRELGKYNRDNGKTPPSIPVRCNYVADLESVHADGNYVGGIAGYLTTANIGGVLGNTLGVGKFLRFHVSHTTVLGSQNGLAVSADGQYAGGALGWAAGGEVSDVKLGVLASVTADNYAGGFVGVTGPGDLLDGGGLNLTLLGVDVVSATNLLRVGDGVRTTYTRANVAGIASGFTVEETGKKSDVAESNYDAGGFAALANSVAVKDCHVTNLLSVTANMQDGVAGGFVGESAAGGLASLLKDSNTSLLHALTVNGLLGAVPYMIPKYDGNSVTYVDGGFVMGDTAGGFAGDFQSGFVNRDTMENDGVTVVTYETFTPCGCDASCICQCCCDGRTADWSYTCGIASEAWSVYNIDHVRGGRYAGGWGGKVYSGALSSAGSGISLLSSSGLSAGALAATDLVSLLKDYVPIIKYAGVHNPTTGYTVYAAHDYADASSPATEGMAGGFIGYGSGVQVSYSHVYKLRHGTPTEPDALTGSDETAYARFGVKPAALESQNGGNYMRFNNAPEYIPYAVAGAHYAGGYIGFMDIGSAASLGDGLKLLGDTISIVNVVNALNVVISTIEHSDVTGCPGGFNVVASPRINLHNGTFGDENGLGKGYAGGYAGKIAGGHIQDGNVKLFEYIVGEIAAGGYVGEMLPGDAASVLKDSSSLSLLADVSGLASLIQDFVPTIRNSETTCVPCGGAVRAECFSDGTGGGSVLRGMAGGYVGHCKGGQIWGESDAPWKEETTYTGVQRECAAIRIRSVYGAEYAGGYCGLMECGSTAETGGLALLGGLVQANNLLTALQAVYPTIKHAAVYGPLQKTDLATWNAWVTYVGSHGAFYPELARLGSFSTQADLDAAIEQFLYGTHVVAGRHAYDNSTNTILSGCAGGFVGSMHSGVIRYSKAERTKLVSAMRAAGGFAGEMQTKGAANFGTANLLGILPLNVGNIAKLVNVFVPCISDAGTEAYRQGLMIQATGDRRTNGVGCAGGYVGGCYGGQLGREHSGTAEHVWIRGLKVVYGTCCIGGFVGKCGAASILDANTNDASSGILQNLLNAVVSTPASLLSVLQATMSTIKYAEVTASDSAWGIVIDGRFKDGNATDYADCAGGFAGYLEAAVLGERKNDSDTLTVENLRSVNGGYYAGGFFGLADVTGVADVSPGGTTSVLDLVYLGNTTLLDAFRTYIYYASVTGVAEGIRVSAHKEQSTGTQRQYQVSGSAGGFGGGLMNGTVEHSSVTRLNTIEAPNYAAGFIAQMGKSGVLDLDQLSVESDSFLGKILNFLGINPDIGAQLLSIVGSTVTDCSASGFDAGFIAKTTQVQSVSHNGQNEEFLTGSCAGGFVGFADTAQINECSVTKLKYLQSPQVAGGFIGRSAMAYVAEIDVDLGLVNTLLTLLRPVIDLLYGLTTINAINLPGGDVLGLQLLAEGNVVYLNLFGLEIAVSLMRNDPEYGGSTDSITITLGSSTIKLPYDPNTNEPTPNASINLIEGNRTSVKNCSVTGIGVGYDVFGGGASQDTEGTDASFGYAGGFVGYNKMGYFSHDRMWLCDVVAGTSGMVGPFNGGTLAGTRSQEYLEGNDNHYSIYRTQTPELDHVVTSPGNGGRRFGNNTNDSAAGVDYNRYDVLHYDVIRSHADLEDATQEGSATLPLEAYASDWKAVLMLETPLPPNPESEEVPPDEMKDPCAPTFDLNVHKKWRDYNNMFDTRPQELLIEVHVIDVGTTPRAQLVQAIYPESGWTEVDFDVLETQISGFKAKFGNSSPIILTLQPNNEESVVRWSGKLEGLPVWYLADNGAGGTEEHYLQYVVVERVPAGYKLVEYQILEDTASVIILNELTSVVLPGTGSSWHDYWYVLTVIPLFIGITFICFRKARRKEVQNE